MSMSNQKLSGTIVFSSGVSGDFDIWTLNLATNELKQLTHGTDLNDMPKWSPDGKRIAFVSNRENGVPDIWIMNADGSNQTKLTKSNKYHSEPSWSPDGKHIICVANYQDSENLDIYALNADGSGTPELLVSSKGLEAGPCLSPDCKHLLFSSTKSGSEDIWECHLETQKLRQVTSHPARDFGAVYSHDGSQIAFITEADETSAQDASADADVWVMSRDGLTEYPITRNDKSDRYVAWSPDSKYVICASRKTFCNADRLNIFEVATCRQMPFDYSRCELEKEIGAQTHNNALLGFLLGNSVVRACYGENYFGHERYPHWKA